MAFTFFDKFADVLSEIQDEGLRHELEVAIVEYGAFRTEPELEFPLSALFAAIRDDIDNSRDMRARGAKGGRPAAKPQVEKVSENQKPMVSDNGKPMVPEEPKPDDAKARKPKARPEQKPQVSENCGALVSDFEKPMVSENSKPRPVQTRPVQTSPEDLVARAPARGFAPPSVAEVREYAEQKGYTFDPESFVAYYAARGWRTNKGAPLKDWRAACVTWGKNEGGFCKRAPTAPQGDEIDWSVYG